MSDNIGISGEETLRNQAAKLTARISDVQLRREAYNKTIKQLTLLYKNNMNRGFEDQLAANQAIDQFSRLVNAAVRSKRDSERDVRVKEAVREQAAQSLRTPEYNSVPKRVARTSPKPEAPVEAPMPRQDQARPAADENRRAQNQRRIPFFAKPAFLSQLAIYFVFLIIAPFIVGIAADPATASMANEILFYFVGPALCASCGAVVTLYCGIDIKAMATMPVLFIANLLLYHGGRGWLWLLCYAACLAAGSVIGTGIRMIQSSKKNA